MATEKQTIHALTVQVIYRMKHKKLTYRRLFWKVWYKGRDGCGEVKPTIGARSWMLDEKQVSEVLREWVKKEKAPII